MQVKVYTLEKEGAVIFGPEEDLSKVQVEAAKIPPAEKLKCKIKASMVEKSPNAGVAAVVPEIAIEDDTVPQASQVQHVPAPIKPVGTGATLNPADAAFQGAIQGGSSDFWKPKENRNIIRILPVGGYLPDMVTPYPFLAQGIHPNIGLSLGDSVFCPRLVFKQACPICNWSWKLYNSTDPNDKELSKKIRSYYSVLANIIDLTEPEKGVQVWSFGKTLCDKIISYRNDPEYGDILDPDNGRNFIIIKKTVSGYPNYDESRPEMKQTSINAQFPNWRKECKDLKTYYKPKTYDELMVILGDTQRALLNTSSTPAGAGKGVDSSAGGGAAVSTASAADVKSALEGTQNK